jgi:Ca2+-binding EF-hand superfamily protein
MTRLVVLATALLLATGAHARQDQKKLPPEVAELLKLDADGFLKKFDKNQDGFVTKDELPEYLAKTFERFDRNGDGKLDRTEIAALLQTLRLMLAPPPEVEAVVEKLLALYDTDKDGKVSKAEAGGALANNFAALDLNQDGFLDRGELRLAAASFLQKKKGPGFGKGAPDFDALDLNADGRLSRAELKGTPFEKVFDLIDTNRDGVIDRAEFEAYLKKIEKK